MSVAAFFGPPKRKRTEPPALPKSTVLNNVVSRKVEDEVICMQNCVVIPEGLNPSHSGFISVQQNEEFNTLTRSIPSSSVPDTILQSNHHLIVTAIAFVDHMRAGTGADIDPGSIIINIGSGHKTRRWHADGPDPLLRTLMAAISVHNVRHTEFMTYNDNGMAGKTCESLEAGSGVYFSGAVVHRSPEPLQKNPADRWFMQIRFIWIENPLNAREKAALEPWEPPTLQETELMRQFVRV